MTTEAILLSGAPGSPYTRKMLAVLRYRRIPYRFILTAEARARGLPQVKVPLLPTFYFPTAAGELEAVTDSSPIIRRLEQEQVSRSVIPSDRVTRFIDMLLEDYGDEWLTKAMFHYRWVYADDIKRAADILPLWQGVSRPDADIAERGRAFAERQISRLGVVGSNPTTTPVIEQSYLRFLDLFNDHLRAHPYLMGRRPGASDFAAYGQLSQLAMFDPTPMALTLTRTPRVYGWSGMIDDLSGAEPDEAGWFTADSIPATLVALLREVGRTYVPVMLANARALAAGEKQVHAIVDGLPWVQQAFPYQGKCVQWIRDAYRDLDASGRQAVDGILAGTGCEALLAG